MTAAEILALINAGYTKAEIAAFDADHGAPENSGDESQEPEANDAGADPGEQAGANEITALKATIAELTSTVKALQAANAKRAEGGKPETPRMTAEDAIKGFFGVNQAKK